MFSGYALVICAALLWGMIGPLSKIAFAAGMTPLEVAFWRTAMAWVLYALHALLTGQAKAKAGDLPLFALFGVVGIGGLFISYVLAVREGGAALASVLLYTAPAWVALMAWKFLREPLNTLKVGAVAATVAGVACVSVSGGSGGSVNAAAVGYGLFSGFAYALYYIFGKSFLARYSTPTLFLYALPVGAACMLPFFTFEARPLSAWLACAALSTLSTYGAYMAYYAGLRRTEATRAAVVATLEPVTAAVLAYFLFGESFTLLGYLGTALILGAVLATIVGQRR